MREILFRGQTRRKGEYIVNMAGDKCESHWVYGGIFPQNKDGDFAIIYQQEPEIRKLTVYAETVGQFTGLTDKNGVRIFEGDIFKFDDEVWESSYTSCGTEYDSFAVENYGVVGFDEEMARFDFIKYKFSENSVEADLHENHTIDFSEFVCELEVIGNIHDNPDILKGGEDNG